MMPLAEEDLGQHLAAFAVAFVREEKKSRFANFAASKKGQQKWLAKLDHFQHELSQKNRTQLRSSSCIELVNELRIKKDTTVAVFSTLRRLTGVRLSLTEAIDQTFKMGNGTIISIEPGKIALYFGEELDQCYLLSSPSAVLHF